MKSAAVLLGAGALSLPLRDLENLKLIGRYLGGEEINCFTKVESDASEYPYDAIAICGGGVGFDSNGAPMPSPIHELRLEAGAIAYIANMATHIVLLDGKLDRGVEPEMNLKHLQGLVHELSQNKVSLPKEAVIVDRVSVNTASNMKQLSEIARNNEFGDIFLITSDFHINGAELNACAYNINASPQAAEDIIIQFDPSREQEILDFYANQPLEAMERKEELRILSAIVDPRGELSIIFKNAQKR